MRILIIEDQEGLAKLLKKGLEKEGHAADYLLDGESGQKRIELHHTDYDVIILDLMLPKRNGLEICKSVRAMNISVPILVLTAKDTLEDKVTLLDSGADDYLVKPFEFEEVLARIGALTRRPESALPTILSAHDLTLNPRAKTASRAGKQLKLTLTEFRLLEYLMKHPNQAVEREELVTNIWDFNFDSFSNIVDVYINRLRTKVDADAEKKFIETVRGVGYKFTI